MEKMKFVVVRMFFCVFVIAAFSKVLAAEDNRMILALYDSKENRLLESNPHRLLEMPLNRLGCIVEYHNILNDDYPDVTKYRGIVVWLYAHKMDEGEKYFEYLEKAIDAGVKVILMNDVGINEDLSGRVYESERRRLLHKMGIAEGDLGYIRNPFAVNIEKLNHDAFGFEITDTTDLDVYRDFKIISDKMKPWMLVSRNDIANSEGVVVAVGEMGGFISDIEMVARYEEDPIWGVLWDLNPFLFLKEALDIKEPLIPDVTTSCGLRAAFMHIDGDGSSNRAIDFSNEHVPCTRILREQLLDKYDFPISVSVIGYRLTEQGSGGEEFIEELRKIMKKPNVQAASHTYTHPMEWGKAILGYHVPGYTYEANMETVGSMEMIKEILLPEGKDVELLLWSGDCEATEEALAALDSAGFQNLNGGNARIDSLYQGICHISPLTVQVGKYRQYYAPAGNEYLYTDSWSTNFGGFVKVIDTFENSKKPRYLPVNVYYHFYLAERQAGLNSLIKIYEWCKTQELNWMQAVEYTRSVTGFLTARTGIDDSGNYYIENYAGLNTVRLDNESLEVDITRSKNVLGYNHFDNDLYISLLPGDRAEIVLTDNPQSGLYVKECTGAVRKFRRSGSGIKAEVRLYSKGFIEFAGVNEGIEVRIGGKKVSPSAENNRRYEVPRGEGEWVELEVDTLGAAGLR